MNSVAKYLGVAVLALSMTACAQGREKEGAGTLLGAAAGGAIGSQIGSGSGRAIAIGTGVLLGGLLGNQIGKRLDEQDRQLAAQNAQQSLSYNRSGTSSTWRNPDTGHQGTFTPQPAYQNSQGQWCREGSHTVTIDGRQETVTNVYCRGDDGVWQAAS
ncbi:MAG: glycine zipper 2TM domain-containing protein [Alphaproteobacteria bacterium]|nr:glycine zipper 2TM domain-containing protein [Alphaproteobacteria bacterium]